MRRGRRRRHSLWQNSTFKRYVLMGVLIIAASLLAVLIAGLLEDDYTFYYPRDEARVEEQPNP
ncbi:hypothetical protein GF324_02105 [bacterium]|nr:hypothetical protein [bacterium]